MTDGRMDMSKWECIGRRQRLDWTSKASNADICLFFVCLYERLRNSMYKYVLNTLSGQEMDSKGWASKHASIIES